MIISAPFREQNPRLRAVGGLIGLGLFLLLGALWRVQVMHGQHYDDKQDAQSLRRIRIPAARGEITDRYGVVLANNRPSYDVAIYLDQLDVPKKSNVITIAQANLGILGTELGLQSKLSDRDIKLHYQKRRPLPLPVWRDLPAEQVAAFSERASTVPGADLIVMPVREYPQGSLAAHLIGYVGKASADDDDDELEKFYYYQPDSVGKQGIEEACDEYLRGSPGGRTIRVNPAGTIAHDLGEKKAELGGRVTLTIDTRLQRIVEKALGGAVPSAGKELCGAVVLLDPRTGEVLATASLPSFDPNVFSIGTDAQTISALMSDSGSPMLNRTIRARYPPGSTFKPITLLAGLEAGVMSPQDRVVCPGFFTIGNHTFHCWNHAGHGSVDAENAIAQSCDVWFYERGLKTGIDAITRTATEFGLGHPTGYDLGNEMLGLVPSAAWKRTQRGEKWWDGDTVQLSIGQSFLLVTPMQMACVAATFANRGTCLRPYVVKQIESSDGQIVHQGQPDVRTHLTAKPSQIDFVRQAMLAAVQSGTARPASVKGLAVAGKTGTAQYDKTINGKTERLDRAWFIGFAPYDQPQFAIAVLIEDASRESATAAAVASKVFAEIFGKSVDETRANIEVHDD